MERLQKLLARAGVCSRRAAERLIQEGRVRVNGERITRLGTCVDAERDVVSVDGKRVSRPDERKTYLILNKPRGYVTTMSDPEGRPTVRDLIKGTRGRVFPVGRLDYDSEGLLLLTNDGDLARELMHPANEVPKTYSIKVRGHPDASVLARLRRGVRVDDRPARASRARLVRSGRNSWMELTVHEGRKHLVRRMMLALNHPVLKLKRVGYAGLELGNLAPGSTRHLTEAEIQLLRKAPLAGPRSGRSRRRANPT